MKGHHNVGYPVLAYLSLIGMFIVLNIAIFSDFKGVIEIDFLKARVLIDSRSSLPETSDDDI